MRIYFDYTCEYGHSWRIFREERRPERPEESLCPEAHEAVAKRREIPIDV
jgi:hypothetical protein